MKALTKRIEKLESQMNVYGCSNKKQAIRAKLKNLSTEDLRWLKDINKKISGDRQELSGLNNGPIVTGANRVDYSKLTDDETEDLMRISRKAYGNN